MLSSIHILLTYACNFECDHCFLFCGPASKGTFTLDQLRALLESVVEAGNINGVCFEGGEPTLYFPLLVEGVRHAHRLGLQTDIVTNSYWASSSEDAAMWLRPLKEAGLNAATISDDPIHFGDSSGAHAERVQAAARELNLHLNVICKQRPTLGPPAEGSQQATIAGGVKFRGRAARKMLAGLPTRPWAELTRCPFEKLADPERVHADCYGHLHLCQGLSMGNFLDEPLGQVIRQYDPPAHPIVGPILRGGPAQLARELDLPHEPQYIDECHMCFEMRLALLNRFPDLLCPSQVYGV